MQVVVGLSCHFVRTSDGRIWTQTMFPYLFWYRYLEVVHHVPVVELGTFAPLLFHKIGL